MYCKAHLTLYTVIIFLFAGCASTYVPNDNHTHMMESQGEVYVKGGFGLNGVNFKGGYAVTDNVGIIGGLAVANFTDSPEREREHSYFEAGVNYFTPMGSRGRVELLGGIGVGSGEAERTDPGLRLDSGDYTKIFVQTNTAISSSAVDAGLSMRAAYVNFSSFESTRDFEGKKTADLFFEPAVFTALGFRNIKFESQLGIAVPFSDPVDIAFDYDFLRFSMGLKFVLNRD